MAEVDLADVLTIVAGTPLVDLSPGERILTDGERERSMFVLVDGELDVSRRGRTVVRIAQPGAILGELGMLLDQPASADVTAVVATRVHRIEDGDELLERSPELMPFLARMLARRLWQVSTYLTDLQEQFADQSATLGLVPTVLRELIDSPSSEPDPGSEREPDAPY